MVAQQARAFHQERSGLSGELTLKSLVASEGNHEVRRPVHIPVNKRYYENEPAYVKQDSMQRS